MACNSWDKLRKAQRDYPKAKFADSFVQKSLKKTPKNPFLLAWKADLSLQLNQEPKNVALQIQQAWQQPGAYDARLLAYLYRLLAEATRRTDAAARCISGLGNENSKAWLSAAKTLGRQERQELWSEMGKAAWREQCWEDFRFAVIQYSKELKDSIVPASVRKHAHFTQILATQLAAEQQNQLSGGGLKSQIQFDLARRLLKQAYEASSNEPIACKDIRDLRFMGEIFARQGKCDELINLWNNPPAALKDLMTTHQADLQSMRIRLSRESQNWSLLESECLATIENAIARLAADPNSKAVWELCAWNNDVWVYLLSALQINRSADEGKKIVSDILHRAFGTDLQTKDRALRLTYMTLRKFIGASLINDCKTFWRHHSTLPSCFTDIRQFVEVLTGADEFGGKAQLFEYFNSELIPGEPYPAVSMHDGLHDEPDLHLLTRNQDNFTQKDRQTHCENFQKLTYLTVASVRVTDWQGYQPKVLEDVLRVACEFDGFHSPNSPAGYIAIYILLLLHHGVMRKDQAVHPFGNTPNSRLLLQATMLARHLVAHDTKDKQDRPRALLAARLHLNLGLGKSAFQMYGYTKCKEMLVHTLSPYVLSRISLTHPFGAQGYGGFSAEEELGKAIGTMERMESKTEDTIYPDISALPWDQAIGLLSLRRKLKSSLTKHICNVERRRIARLKGEPVDQLPTLDQQSFQDVVDNVDTSVFPDYGSSQAVGPVPLIMPNMVPNLPCIVEGYSIWDTSSRVLYRETQTGDHDGSWVDKVATPAGGYQVKSNMTVAEITAERMWLYINTVVEVMDYGHDKADLLSDIIKQLPENLHAIRLAMEKLRVPDVTNLKPEDEPTMFHENMLISCYTKLEVLRALSKMVDHLREKVIGPKSSHPMKAKLPKNWVNEIESETKICYEAIRDVANSYIKLVERRGEAAIKAQVRWGTTGEILRDVMTDSDVELYASEYVDSALQAWKGVLQVKLK